MRKLLLAALACVAMPANATLIQVDLAGNSLSIEHGELIYGPLVNASFLLDTFDLSSMYYGFGESGGQTCVSAFNTAFGLRHASISYDGVETISTSGTAYFYGDGPPPCRGWFSGLAFETPEMGYSSPHQSWSGISFDLAGVYTIEQFLASSDPIVDLLSFGMIVPHLRINGVMVPAEYLSVYEVPEPGTLGLLSLGVLGAALVRRRITPPKSRGQGTDCR